MSLLAAAPKLIAQKALGAIPGAHGIQEGFKLAIGHWDRRIHPGLVRRQLQRNIDTFSDLEGDVRQSIARIQASPFVVHKDVIRGFVYEVETGRLREVE